MSMKRRNWGRAGAGFLLGLAGCALLGAGCVAVQTDSGRSVNGTPRETSVKWLRVSARDGEIVPVATRLENGDVEMRIRLSGAFEKEVHTATDITSRDGHWWAIGFFPGVMGCQGEQSRAVGNALGACWYNVVYAGLPTVYGLLVEPFTYVTRDQKDSVFGKSAFALSPILGFCKYKKWESREETDSRRLNETSVFLEDAVLSCPELEVKSRRGEPLRLTRRQIEGMPFVSVVFSLPEDHPFKQEWGFAENEAYRCTLLKGKE